MPIFQKKNNFIIFEEIFQKNECECLQPINNFFEAFCFFDDVYNFGQVYEKKNEEIKWFH